jgi:RNA polymerase sigma factor (sigma-70 family)
MDTKGNEIKRLLKCLQDGGHPMTVSEICRSLGIDDGKGVRRLIESARHEGHNIPAYNDRDAKGNQLSRYMLRLPPEIDEASEPLCGHGDEYSARLRKLTGRAQQERISSDDSKAKASVEDGKTDNRKPAKLRSGRYKNAVSRRKESAAISSTDSGDELLDSSLDSERSENYRRRAGYARNDSEKAIYRIAALYKPLEPAEESRLLRLVMKGGNDATVAEGELVRHFTRLAIKIAGVYEARDWMDLTHEAIIGLIRAIRKYDFKKGSRLATYASYWMQGQIENYLAKRGRTIKLPVRTVRDLRRMKKLREERTQGTASPSDQELADILGLSLKRVQSLQELLDRGDVLSLDQFLDSGEQENAADESHFYQPELEADTVLDREYLVSMLEMLSPRERLVVAYRYGLMQTDPMTLEEISCKLGLSPEGVRQVLARALHRLGKQPFQ